MHLRPLIAALGTLALPLMFIAAETATPPAPAAAPAAASRPKIGSGVYDWEKLVMRKVANGERRDVANNPTNTLSVFECHISTLNPGEVSHPPHQHGQEELIIVKEGILEVHINGKLTPAPKGSTIFYSSRDMHAVKNIGDKPATYFVVNLATPETNKTPDEALVANPKRVKSGVWTYESLTARPSKVGEGRRILDGPTLTLANLETHITTINGGEAPHAAHNHPDDEVVLLREGTLEVNINGTLTKAGPGSVLLFASNDLHGMRNIGTTPATYHVIRIVTKETPKAAPAAAKK